MNEKGIFMDETKGAAMSIALAGVTAFAAQHCLQPVISAIAQTFSLGPAQASLVVSAGMIGMALMALLLALSMRYIPRKRSIVGALLVAGLASIAMGLNKYFAVLIGLRLLQGAILGLVPVLVLAYIQECFPPTSKSRLVSLYVGGTTIGGVIGRFLASYLTDLFTWQLASIFLGALYIFFGMCIQFTMPDEFKSEAKAVTAAVDFEHFLSKEYRKVLYLAAIAFCSLGSFAAIYNYISYVLLAPPYNFSHTMMGMLFFVQLFGTVGSILAGRLNSYMPPAKIISMGILAMLLGSLLTLGHAASSKAMGIALVTFGLFSVHTIASSWCGTICPGHKESAVGMYMFAYYCGGSLLGTLAGIMFKHWHWYGVVSMSIIEAALCLLALYKIILLEKELASACASERLVKAH